jgi:hypothetical protein
MLMILPDGFWVGDIDGAQDNGFSPLATRGVSISTHRHLLSGFPSLLSDRYFVARPPVYYPTRGRWLFQTYSPLLTPMWPPPDITVLPTSQEVIDAKLAIETVKAQLNDALLALAQAQLRVDEINKELFERNAWIAPVRFLSFDVLSLIFEFCGEDDWRTPLPISEVS